MPSQVPSRVYLHATECVQHLNLQLRQNSLEHYRPAECTHSQPPKSYGAEVEHSNDKHFECAECHARKWCTSHLFAAKLTAAIQHLVEFHNIKWPSCSITDDYDIDATDAAEVFQLIIPLMRMSTSHSSLIDWAVRLPTP